MSGTQKLWVRGGFPLSYLADDEELSTLWHQNYIKTFLERDIPNLGFTMPSMQLRRFWLMLCHASELEILYLSSYRKALFRYFRRNFYDPCFAALV